MKKNQTDPSTDFVSRRTGLDRRWIPSEGHQPERRRGRDRRAVKPRTFLDKLDGDRQGSEPGGIPAGTDPNAPPPVSEFTDGAAHWPHLQREPAREEDTAVDG